MKAFCVFDDFPKNDIDLIREKGIELDVLPKGQERPAGKELESLLNQYDVLIIGTGQKLEISFFDNVTSKKIIVTASTGTDHIKVPENKKELVTIINSPTAIAATVAEHVFAFIFAQEKLLFSGRDVAYKGEHKKSIGKTPQDISGKTLGIIGFGHVGQAVTRFANVFNMSILANTATPKKYKNYKDVKFVSLDTVLMEADIIVMAVPLTETTKNLISKDKIDLMKSNGMFISVSRPESCDNDALLAKAEDNANFRVCLDYDADKVQGKWNKNSYNILVTPHIAGGTVQSRIRLFDEASKRFLELLND